MAAQSRILAWEIPRTEEPGGLQSMGLQESDMTQRLNKNIEYIALLYKCQTNQLVHVHDSVQYLHMWSYFS